MKLVVDTREHKLHNLITCPFEIEQLHIGDACIKQGDTVLIAIERKTVDDLAASIKDGRFKEQLMRLQSCGAQVAYVIEGHKGYMDDGFVNGLPLKAINSTLYKLQFKYKIPCFHTGNTFGTATLLAGLLSRFETGKHEEWGESPSTEDYTNAAIKPIKKENLTTELAFIQQLCCIPGISSAKAKLILSELKCANMFELVQKLGSTTANPSATLTNIPGIGTKLASSILTYLGLK
jgi:ERCC4-type nuclease